MKIYSASQLKEADSVSIKKQQITSEQLMERAASLVFKEIHSRLKNSENTVWVFCGIGNNGGDGLVVARLLQEQGYKVKVYVVAYSDKRSDDFKANFKKLKLKPETIESEEQFPEISSEDWVVDAIFGIGLNRGIKGWIAHLVENINHSGAYKVAVDMPSGLFADRVPSKEDAVIKADLTLSFQAPKLVFFLPQTMDHVGEFKILDIGLDKDFLEGLETDLRLTTKKEAFSIYRPRKKNSHKGTYGHTMVVGGSYGKIGSVVLASRAVLKSGAGLCTLFVPRCGYSIVQTNLPEAMVLTDADEEKLTGIDISLDPDVVCFGMGAGKKPDTVEAFKKLLHEINKPMLIDADGLNMLSEHRELLPLLPKNSVLTPHPKELERLIGEWEDDFQKIEKVRNFVRDHEVILVLKGAYSFVFSRDGVFINSSGNPGMATAGSGDVLSGVIAGLLSQKYEPICAAVLGVYLHAKAGDIAAEIKGQECLVSGDISEYLGAAYKYIKGQA